MNEITTENKNIQTIAQNRNEIDVQISTARNFPRAVATFVDRATSMAIYNRDQAAACVYSVPRAGKQIMGASVRLAEIAAYCWGNLHCATRILEQTHAFITAEAVAWDLENNVRIITQVKRSILTKDGKTYSQDMIITTGNAAASIALRNAILKVIPKTLVNEVYNKALAFAFGTNGKEKTIEERIKTAFDLFDKELKVNKEQVFKLINKTHEKEVTLKDLEFLTGVYHGIKAEGNKYEDYLPDDDKKKSQVQKQNLTDLTKQLEEENKNAV